MNHIKNLHVPLWISTLISIYNTKGCYSSLLAKKTNITYSHIVKILQSLEKINIITMEKEGRRKQIFLTPKGENLAKRLLEVKECIQN